MSPVAMWIVDPETRRITHYNKVAHETLGYGRKEFKGLSIKDVEAKETDNDTKEKTKLVKEAIEQNRKKEISKEMILQILKVQELAKEILRDEI